MIEDIQEEICLAIEQTYDTISKMDYNAFILLIGRAEIQKGLKAIVGTDCVMEYMMDIYFDETRSRYYLNYLKAITTVNQKFLKDGELKVQTLGRGFAWLDTGTHDSLTEATNYIETIEKRQGLKVACLEGIALRKGWITTEKMRELAKPMLKNQYGQYLMKMADEFEKNGAGKIDEF